MKPLKTAWKGIAGLSHKYALGMGLLAGVLLAAPVIGVLYLLDQLAGFPFVPFALFDWIVVALPGPVVTFGIDLMIDSIRLLGLSVADAAKTSEQIMAVLLLYFILVVAAVGYFAVVKARGISPRSFSGLALGLALGLPLALISGPRAQSSLSASLILLGLLLLFLAWGLALVPAYRRLVGAPAAVPTPQPAPVPPEHLRSVDKLDRRQFLIRLGATTATITVLSGGLGAVLARAEQRQLDNRIAATTDTATLPEGRVFPNANDPLVPAPGTRQEYTPVENHYKVFLRTEPTNIDIATWTLPITGLVDNPLTLTIDQIRNNYPSREQYITLACISGRVGTDLISTTHWTGVSLQHLLADARPQPEARYLVITSADGFHETVDLSLIDGDQRIMLAYDWDGRPIPMDHGFPLRIWIPDRYGMKQPKWITGIEVTSEYQEGYWVQRGWDEVARMRTTAVIDTVAVDDIYQQGEATLVPVGGIAFAGARGISRAEVRVDGGPWRPAQLRRPLSDTTWVIWRYDWPFQAGRHTFEVRCAEGDGTPQIEQEMGNRPSGATGIHRKEERL